MVFRNLRISPKINPLNVFLLSGNCYPCDKEIPCIHSNHENNPKNSQKDCYRFSRLEANSNQSFNSCQCLLQVL